MDRTMIQLPGVKISLRDWRVSDLDTHARRLVPGQRWQELDGPYYLGPTLDEIPALIARQRAGIMAPQLPWPRSSLVIAHAQTDAPLGLVNWHWESVETYWPLIGILIYDPAHWQQGYGYEALGLWGDYLFRELPQIVRLDLRTWSGNRGMMRLALKLGFVEEARFRQARIVKNVYYDGLGYGVLRSEWTARYPDGFAAGLL
ncbi:MAG: GNAT family N-acetyltransferase [Chloroflexaceae bacterium]